MSTPPVFRCPAAELAGPVVTLAGAEGRHAATVRRLVPGEPVQLTDGNGQLADCTVTAVRPAAGELDLAVLGRQAVPPPQPRLTVVQAIPKGDRGELAAELLTEAGADVIVPWAAERCVARWQPPRDARSLARWRSAAAAAARQSRRCWFPEVTAQASLAEVGQLIGGATLALLLDPAGECNVGSMQVPAGGNVVVIVGPEGGITDRESAQLGAAGAVAARLGPLVLRTSTAGAVAAAVLLSRTGRWT